MNAVPISHRIKQLRACKGWSQAQLAQEAKLGESTVQRAETDGRCMRAGTLQQIANALGASLAEIVNTPVVAAEVGVPSATIKRRGLGEYGSLLVALSDASREILEWRRRFLDPLAYHGFFARGLERRTIVRLEGASYLAAKVSMSLDRDISDALEALVRVSYEAQQAAVCLRSHTLVGYGLSPEQRAAITLTGIEACNNAEFYLTRAETQVREYLHEGSAA
jgi:transcriptional regulator with XRE-family HTH domain